MVSATGNGTIADLKPLKPMLNAKRRTERMHTFRLWNCDRFGACAVSLLDELAIVLTCEVSQPLIAALNASAPQNIEFSVLTFAVFHFEISMRETCP